MRVLDDKGTVLAETIVGKQRPASGAGKAGTYVRKPGEAQAWLASTEIPSDMAVREWAKSRVFETPPEKVAKVTVQVGADAPYEIKRDADGNHDLADVPAGKRVKFVNALENLVTAAAFMEFDDVRKAPAGTTPDAGTVVLESDNGLKATMKFRRDKDAVWFTISAAGEGPAKAIADELKTRTDGWEFKILPSKAQAILQKRDELLEDAAS